MMSAGMSRISLNLMNQAGRTPLSPNGTAPLELGDSQEGSRIMAHNTTTLPGLMTVFEDAAEAVYLLGAEDAVRVTDMCQAVAA